MKEDLLTETIESIANNFINGNRSDCKRQIQELGAESPMILCYAVLQINILLSYNNEIIGLPDSNTFQMWVSNIIQGTKQ